MPTLAEQIEADVSDVFLDTDEFAESLSVVDPNGISRSITAVVERQPERIERRAHRRVRVEAVVVSTLDTTAGLLGVEDGWAADVDADPQRQRFDYLETQDKASGMITCLFERVTILETGTPDS